MLNRLTDLNERRQVHHRIKTSGLNQWSQQDFVCQSALHKVPYSTASRWPLLRLFGVVTWLPERPNCLTMLSQQSQDRQSPRCSFLLLQQIVGFFQVFQFEHARCLA